MHLSQVELHVVEVVGLHLYIVLITICHSVYFSGDERNDKCHTGEEDEVSQNIREGESLVFPSAEQAQNLSKYQLHLNL